MDRAAFTRAATSLEVLFIGEMVLGMLATISIFYYNFPLFALGYALLAADRARENVGQLQVFSVLLFISFVLDITIAAIYTNQYNSGAYKFGLSMTIIGLLFKPLIALVLWRDLRGRGVALPEPPAVLQFGGTPYQAMDGPGAPAIVSGTDEKPPLAPVVATGAGDYSGSSGNYGGASSGNYQSV